MKNLLLAGFFMLAILLPGAPLTAVKTGDELVIDGKLDDAAWKNALVFDKFFVNGRNECFSNKYWNIKSCVHNVNRLDCKSCFAILFKI